MSTAARDESPNIVDSKFHIVFVIFKISFKLSSKTSLTAAQVAPKSSDKNTDAPSSSSSPPAKAFKSLLEGNGFKVVKKIGSGSYSKVKVARNFH